MRGALQAAPLRPFIVRHFEKGSTIASLVRDWTYRFPETSEKAVSRFIERILAGDNLTVTRNRGDEAALVLGLMPTDVWGEEWWR